MCLETDTNEYILCAAVYLEDEQRYLHQPVNITYGIVVAGRRHHNCFLTLSQFHTVKKGDRIVQGFLTSCDRFVDRREAAKIAFRARQIEKEYERLHSEHLY